MTNLTSILKDRVIFGGWVAGMVIIIALLWSLTFAFRADSLKSAVNKTLSMMGNDQYLSASLPHPPAGQSPMGCWYTLYGSRSLFFVFVMMKDGILVPCGAEIAEDGIVTEIIPLGNHAQQVMNQIPQGMIQIYVRRIESAAAVITAGIAERGEG